MTVVHLITGSDMPKPDPESHLVVAALDRRAIEAELLAWDDPRAGTGEAALTVIRTPWDYPDRRDEFLAWCGRADEASRLLNPPAVLAHNSHKGYLTELGTAGVAAVPTLVVEPGGDVPTPDWEAPDGYVIKPAVSSGARGAARFDDLASGAARAHLDRILAAGDAIVQPYLPAVAAAGERSLIFLGGELSHAVNKRPASGDYRVQEIYGGTVAEHRPAEAEVSVAREALAAVPGDLLYARVDLVPAPAGPLLIELELIEPELFLGAHPDAGDRLAGAIAAAL